MKPEWDLREIVGIVAKEKVDNVCVKHFLENGLNLTEAKNRAPLLYEWLPHYFVKIPNKDYAMMKVEVWQDLYTSIIGSNPSQFEGDYNPVEKVSWFDAIYFCNKLSEYFCFTPVYSVNGTTDVTKWNYTPHNGNSIREEVEQNTRANGFRLPTSEEWEYAARGGQNYTYSGSNNLDEVGWYDDNSGGKTHPVAQKKSNGYGLYDMSGNVCEWCWDASNSYYRYYRGGSYDYYDNSWKVDFRDNRYASSRRSYLGFRIVCSASN